MSTNRTSATGLGQSILTRVRTEWVPAHTHGYDPTAAWGTPARVYAHLGEYDDGVDEPQVTIRDVSSTEISGGTSGIKGDGSGPVQKFDTRLQADAWVDQQTADRVSVDDPGTVAYNIAAEVADIIHDTVGSLLDPATGEVRAEMVAPLGEPVVTADPEVSMAVWRASLDVGARTRQDPPTR